MDMFDIYLKEAYFGKSAGILEIEKCLDEFLNEVKKDYTKDYNNHPLNLKLQNLFCKQFGFKKCFIIWTSTPKGTCNVSTAISADIIFKNNRDMLTKKQDGYYDKHHQHVCIIYASTTLPTQANLTTSEYLGILLHEIGHNFDASVYGAIHIIFNYLGWILYYPKFYPKMYTNKGKEEIAKNTIKEVKDYNSKYDDEKSKSTHIYKIRMEKYLSGVSSLILAPIYLICSPLFHLSELTVRKGEEFADSFATAYGYGSEMISGLNKITYNDLLTNNKKYQLNHFDKFLTDLALAQRYIIQFAAGACHGTNDTRLITSLNMLKKDIKNHNYPPELKKELYNEVKKLEKTYELYNSPLYKDKEKLYISYYVRKMICIIFGKRSDFIAKLFPNNYAKNNLNDNKFNG